jgi:hypothetical protein
VIRALTWSPVVASRETRRVKPMSQPCIEQLHERCTGKVDGRSCKCHCHGSWGELAGAGVVVAVAAVAFGTVGWVLRGWLR